MAEVDARFAAEAQSQAQALRGLGIDARVGEVPGEYCPGRFSVNARGQTKLIGAAQRIISGAWLFSTVVVVDGAARVRAVLEEVYAALELTWDPASVGSIADELPGATVAQVRSALLAPIDGAVSPGAGRHRRDRARGGAGPARPPPRVTIMTR